MTPTLPLTTKPHPLDAALAALSEAAAELLAGDRPSRFGELQTLARIASAIQRLRPGIGVDDVLQEQEEEDAPWVGRFGPVIGRHRVVPFNDGVDLNREIIMVAQKFFDKYIETEQLKAKRPSFESRLDVVTELSELMALRLRLMNENQPVHESIHARIDHLLKRIGESTHEPERDPVVCPEPLRGYPADGARAPDGDRVGEPLAERAGGDAGAR
jgi:hypothetical protein